MQQQKVSLSKYINKAHYLILYHREKRLIKKTVSFIKVWISHPGVSEPTASCVERKHF